MNNDERPITLDPARLRDERHDADLGTTEETGHAGTGNDRDPRGEDPVTQPTGGAVPPAR
jgi:hypothetical protein